MEILIIPSILAISIKIGIFWRYHSSLRKENFDLGVFFVAVFFLNIFELLSIKAEFAAETSRIILLAYYCCVIFTIHGLINVVLQYSGFNWQTSRIKLGLNVVLAALIIGLFTSPAIIAGVEPINNFSLIRIPGDYYWLFQVYLFSGLAMVTYLLIYGLRHASNNIDRQKCLVVMISAATPMLMAISVVGLMAIGIKLNGAIFMSLTLSLMLGLMVYSEEKTRLFRLLTMLPYTRERQFHKQMLSKITDCIAIGSSSGQQALNLKQMMKELEGSVVEHVIGYYNGNQKRAAQALGVSEATISRRARASLQQPTVASSSQAPEISAMAMTEKATSS